MNQPASAFCGVRALSTSSELAEPCGERDPWPAIHIPSACHAVHTGIAHTKGTVNGGLGAKALAAASTSDRRLRLRFFKFARLLPFGCGFRLLALAFQRIG